MKKSLAKEILSHLASCSTSLIVSSLFIPHGQGLGRTLREIEKKAARCPHDFSRHSHGTVSVALHRMKKQKLVSISGPKKKAVWRITQRGKSHFKKAGGLEIETELPKEDGKTRVVMFDIPENKRRERNWLRMELAACDYTPLQKSVFLGLRPLPVRLLEELKERELLSHIHVVGLEESLN